MARPVGFLDEISANVAARVQERMAASREAGAPGTSDTHWLLVLLEEFELSEEEVDDSVQVAPDTYRTGYHQGWHDAIRMILGATQLFEEANPNRTPVTARPAEEGSDFVW